MLRTSLAVQAGTAVLAIGTLAFIVILDGLSKQESSSNSSYSNLEYTFSASNARKILSEFTVKGIAAVSISVGLHFLAVFSYSACLLSVLAYRMQAPQRPLVARLLRAAVGVQVAGSLCYLLAAVAMTNIVLLEQDLESDTYPLMSGICDIGFLLSLGLSVASFGLSWVLRPTAPSAMQDMKRHSRPLNSESAIGEADV